MYGNGSPPVWLVVFAILNMDVIANISSDNRRDVHPFLFCLDTCLHLYNEDSTDIGNPLTGKGNQLLKLLEVSRSHPQSNIDHAQDFPPKFAPNTKYNKRTVTVDRLFNCHKSCMDLVMSRNHTIIGK
ncbi:hypothetical protein SNE40_007266 [Patella caerulea]|uniref:Uncharacterized protein n=1 Tax=Patella caerulea TaxID=87958 RepID=A0AAN8K4A3_PATCE